jgi:hypothetical protein
LSQNGTAKADAEAGIDAWRDLLAFLDNAKTLGLNLPATVLARADEVID